MPTITINCSFTCDTSKLESDFAKVQKAVALLVEEIKKYDQEQEAFVEEGPAR